VAPAYRLSAHIAEIRAGGGWTLGLSWLSCDLVHPPTCRFFVLRKYHRGVRRWAAAELFGMVPGHWTVSQQRTNPADTRFGGPQFRTGTASAKQQTKLSREFGVNRE